MTRISIEPPLAHSSAHVLRQANTELDGIQLELRRQWAHLAANWEGRDKSRVEYSVNSALDALTRISDEIDRLGVWLQEIARRFEEADESTGASLAGMAWGGGGTPAQPGLPGGVLPDHWGEVLGAADPEGSLKDEPTLLEWLKGLFDLVEGAAGRFAAENVVTQWLKAFGTTWKGIDLMTSSGEVASAHESWDMAMNRYGLHSPEALQARWSYSSAELSQVIPAPLKLLLSGAGLWDDLIGSYEHAKYESRGLIPPVQ